MSIHLFFKNPARQFVALNLEKIVWEGKPTVLSFYHGIIGGTFLTTVSIVILIMFPHAVLYWVSVAGFAVGALMVSSIFIGTEANTYVITDKCVRWEYRLFTIEAHEVPFEQITNITVFQGIVGKVLKFGNVRADSAAGEFFGGVVFRGVREPGEVKKKIMVARERALTQKK